MLTPIWTIGHSNRPPGSFFDLLEQHRLEALADVRRFPGSRRQPAYAQDALRRSLRRRGIEYRWLPALGGRRRPRIDSRNQVWRNASFRGYADHMESAEFAAGMDALLELCSEHRSVIMCAEALWWRCHRALIADALYAGGIEVLHILDERHCTPHPLTSAARIARGRLSYELR